MINNHIIVTYNAKSPDFTELFALYVNIIIIVWVNDMLMPRLYN
jgi:hypothetical protein